MKVSIIIPAYNRGDLIGETIESIISQTYANWECIVVDDGSQDNTEVVVIDYVNRDSRISFYNRPKSYKSGANGARNYGFTLAQGDYVCWFDSDDLMHESYLEKQLNNFREFPEIQMSVCYAKIFEGNRENIIGETIPFTNQLDSNIVENLIKYKITFPTPCCVWKKSFLDNKDLFDENLLNAQESEFNFKRCIEGVRFRFVTSFLVYVRRGHASIISTNNSNYKKIQSQYDYYNFIYKYLKGSDGKYPQDIKPKGEMQVFLLKYCIHRKLSFFSSVRNGTIFFKKIDFKNTIDLMHNINDLKIPHLLKLKTIFGILLLFLFNKGFVFINEFKQLVK